MERLPEHMTPEEREEAAMQSALDMLRHATYNQPSRSGCNSRYMQSFALVLLAGAVLAGVASLIGWLFHAW